MPLQVQPDYRFLSHLEQHAVELVFGGSLNVYNMRVRVLDQVGGGHNGVHDGNGRISLSRQKHAFAEDLDGDTELEDIDTTIPNNIKYLATLVHEAGHHWQRLHDRFTTRIGYYNFDDHVLDSLDWQCREQHASVGQVYFMIKFQLDQDHDSIDLTRSAFAEKNVGPADRYEEIAEIPLNNQHKRWVDVPDAQAWMPNFDGYLDQLREEEA